MPLPNRPNYVIPGPHQHCVALDAPVGSSAASTASAVPPYTTTADFRECLRAAVDKSYQSLGDPTATRRAFAAELEAIKCKEAVCLAALQAVLAASAALAREHKERVRKMLAAADGLVARHRATFASTAMPGDEVALTRQLMQEVRVRGARLKVLAAAEHYLRSLPPTLAQGTAAAVAAPTTTSSASGSGSAKANTDAEEPDGASSEDAEREDSEAEEPAAASSRKTIKPTARRTLPARSLRTAGVGPALTRSATRPRGGSGDGSSTAMDRDDDHDEDEDYDPSLPAPRDAVADPVSAALASLGLTSEARQAATKRRQNLSAEQKATLSAWLQAHLSHPYPSDAEKTRLAAKIHTTVERVTNWFINARAREL